MSPPKPPPPTILSEEDALLWQELVQNVQPLLHTSPLEAQPPINIIRKADINKNIGALPTPKPPKNTAHTVNSLPTEIRQALQIGHKKPEAKLDLHGMSLETAHQTLFNFLSRCAYQEKRNLLVITGKGGGILRNELPHWLETAPFAQFVQAFGVANNKHGGEGAWYVRLRK